MTSTEAVKMNDKNSMAAPEGQQGMTIDQAIVAAYQHWNAGQAAQAEHLCQQILKLWPEHAVAVHLLGLLAYTAGNRSLAIDYLQRACRSPSAPALFHSNLAEMLRQDGRMHEAEAAARRALALDSQLGAAWTNLGIILQEAGKLEESLDCLKRAVAITTDSPENHNNLGNTLKRMGKIEEARAQYEAAIFLKPGYAEAHNNLAFLLHSLGDNEKAATEVKRAIELNPQYADAYINAAAIALAMGLPQDAVRWLDNLANFAPNHPGGLTARAKTLLELDAYEAALEVARRAVSLAPENGEAAEVLAQALAMLGRTDEALAAFDRAARLPCPERENAMIGKAALLGELGRMEEVAGALDAALTINPCSARALFNRSLSRKYAEGDAEVERMEALLSSGKLLARDDILALRFALGKAWLDIGDETRAFLHFNEGNRLKRSTFEYDAPATARWMQSIAETVSDAALERLSGAGDSSESPVFVLGMPRSGTTLVEQILAAHPKVHGAGELNVMQQIADRMAGPDRRLLGYPQLIDAMQSQDAAKLGRYYVERLLPKAPGAARIVDKMPANFLYAGLIRIILPNARIIHCKRDAADTCLSCYTKLFAGEQKFAYDLKELGLFHNSYSALMSHWRALLAADRFVEVQYEEVVDDLEGQAKRLIAFLGLDWDPACLQFYANKRQIRTASLDQVRKPIYRTSIGRARKYAAHLAPLFEALGATP
jgi:tetratricopeptide (TPR) repeat protein